MKKFKFLLIVMLGFFFLASCSLDQTKFPTAPGDDEITEGEESYTLTFKYYDSLETIVSYTKKITNPVLESDISVTVPNGYALSFVDEAGQAVEVDSIRTTSTVYVKFSPKEYTLRFIEGGTVVSNKLVAYNETIEAIDATKVPTGKKFIGWSSSENEYVEYVFDKMPSESVVLYAFYEELQYSITLKTNVLALEGYNNVTTYKYGDRLGNFVPSDLQAAIDSLDNYVFVGWYLDESCTEKFNEIAMPAKNITLYAKWDYAGLTFFDGTSIIEVLDGELGDTIVFPEVPEKAGYTFVGWFYDEELTQEVPANAVITEDLRAIYAKYSSNERPYKVEYYLQSLGVSYVLNVDATINAKGNTGDFVTAEIKSFEGFTYNANHQGNVVEGNVLGDGSLVLKVYYTRNSYSIKFYTDGNLYHEATLKYGAAVATPATPSKVGYTFKGWSPVVPATMPANDVTVEAVFEINTYVFTYIVEGVETEVEYQYGASVATPADPSKGGFKFAGWSPVVPLTMPANDVTVEATWIKKLLEVGEGKDYSTITEALLYAEAGDTITVFAGTYSEDVVIEKSITINGANVNINPNTDVRNSASVVNTFTIKASNVTINGFDIADATTSKSLITISNGNYSNISIENIVVLKQTVFSNNAYGIITASATETNEITNLVIDGLRIEQSTKRPTAFYGCQINGFTLTNSELLGATSAGNYTDCIKIATDGSYGLKGNISITNNVFKDYHQYILWLREIGTSVIEVANNEFINCGQTAGSHGAFTLASYASNAQTISVDFHDNELDNAYIMFRVDAWNNATSENLILNCNNNNIKNSLGTYHVKNGNSVSLVDATNNTYDVVPTANKFLNAIYYTIIYNDQEASWGYKDFEDLAADLLKDYNTYTGKSYTKDTIPSDAWTSINLDDFFYSGTNKAKWSWLTDLLGIIGGSANKKALSLLSKYFSASEFNAINSNYQYAVTYELRAVMMIGKYTKNANYITSDYSDVNIQNQIMTTLKNSLAITKGTGEHTLTNKLYKEGYTFVGWYDNPEFTGTPITVVSYDATLYAKFSKNISISYEENGGNWGYASYEDLIADLLNDYNTARNKSHTVDSFYALGSMSEISDASLFLYNATYRAKWAWLVDYIASVAGSANKAAWSNFNNYNSQAELNAAGSNNIYCVAYELRGFIGGRQYTKNSSFVTYDYSVDSNKVNAMNALAKSIKIEKGFDVITLPTNIYKEGYTFIGWYDNAEFNGTPITTVTDNITVYARFDLNIEIEFEYNDGNYNYESYEELIADLLKDYNAYSGGSHTSSSLFAAGKWAEISTASNFLYDATYRAKWAWLVDYIASVAGSANKAAWSNFNKYNSQAELNAADSNNIYCIAYELRAFIGGGQYTQNSGFVTYDYSVDSNKTNAMNAYNESIEVTSGIGSITLPTNLYKQHYTFVGWYDNAELTGTPITVATSNMTLYAKWDAIEYSIEYDLDGGTNASNPNNYTIEESFVLLEPSKVGYTFIGWTYDGQDTPVINATIALGSTGNKTFKANWEINEYKITYYTYDGVELGYEMIEYNQAIALPSNPEKDDYVFMGWVYENGSLLELSNMPANNINVYESWGISIEQWQLVTNVNDLSVGDQIVIVAKNSNVALSTTQNGNNRGQVSVTKNTSNNTVTFGSNVQKLTLTNGTVSGEFGLYTGSGYLYAASSSSNYLRTQTTNNANGSWKITITSAGVATIMAQGSNTRNWLRQNSGNSIFSCYGSGQNDVSIYKYVNVAQKVDLVNIKYDINGGTGTISPMENVKGSSFVIPTIDSITAPAGKLFKEWNSKIDGTGVAYEEGQTITLENNLELFAIWEEVANVILSFNSNGGTGNIESITKEKYSTFTIPSIDEITPPTGMLFVSWNTKQDGTGTSYNEGDLIELDENLELFAIWETISNVTLSFNANGGTGTISSIENIKGSIFTVPAIDGITAPSGMKFKEWNTNSDGTGTSYVEGDTIELVETLELFAIWENIIKDPVSVVAKYPTGTTTNMSASGNQASTIGLNSSIFTVTATKNDPNNNIGLNKDGTIRLYANKSNGNGNTLTISSEKEIAYIIITFGGTVGSFKVNDIVGSKSTTRYEINGNSFSIQNTTTGDSTQVHIKSITIYYYE